ncbi:MAG TPA: cold-shock protein [Candidatus Stackebrandtia faecavium]|nr:cold-shock protein [Candidatus Stackebrandtia faecavium]
MQATVAAFDPDTHRGKVLLDSGYSKEFDSDAFAVSGLRLLRLGQRVALDLTPEGRVAGLWIPTMPAP